MQTSVSCSVPQSFLFPMFRFLLIFTPAFFILAHTHTHAQTQRTPAPIEPAPYDQHAPTCSHHAHNFGPIQRKTLVAQRGGTVTDCGNLGVETGSWIGWEGLYGKWAADKANNKVKIMSEDIGLDSARFFVRTAADGFIPEIYDEPIPYVPPGSQYAIQLGNSRNGSEYERLVASFVVDSTNSMFQYRFAVIFEDPDHSPIEQPKFEVLVKDQQGNTVPCGFYQVTAGGNIPGFKSQGVLRYRNWTTAAVDLRNYIGQIVTLELSTYDCSQGGHWGMALFDAACIAPRIQLEEYCPGQNNAITLEAPEGFRDYRWSTGDTTRVIQLANVTIGQELHVEFTPFSSLSDACKLSLSMKVPPKVEIVLPDSVAFCKGGEAQVFPSLPKENTYAYKWLPGGETSKNLTVRTPGLYFVEAKKGDCILRDTVLALERQPPAVVFTPVPPSCAGKTDGQIKASANYPEPILFRWSTGDNTSSLQNLAPGTYTVSVTGAQSGCSSSGQTTLPEGKAISVAAKLMRMPGCLGQAPNGEAQADAFGGTAPYAYRWNTGADTSSAALPSGGVFRVTATDARGCEAIDSVRVVPLRVSGEATGNYCPDGKAGSVAVEATGGRPPYVYGFNGGIFEGKNRFEGLPNGTYMLYVKDAEGCMDTVSERVRFMRPDTFRVALTTDTSIVLGQTITIKAVGNYAIGDIEWYMPWTDPVLDALEQTFLPLKTGELSVFATDEHGCRAEAAMMLTVEKTYGRYIPNVFTPTGGENPLNSRFYMSANMEQLKAVPAFRVFDRWGNKVFESFNYVPNEPAQGWDGQFEGRSAPTGVYTYRIDIEYIDGHREVAHGDVTLLR